MNKTDVIGELVDWFFLAGLSFYVGLLIGALLFGKPHQQTFYFPFFL